MARKRSKRNKSAYKITVPSSDGDLECYSLDLDQLDLGLLPVENLLQRLRSYSNSNVPLLWRPRKSAAFEGNSATSFDGKDCQSFTVHAVKASPSEDDEESVSSLPSDRLTDLAQSRAQSTRVTQSYVQVHTVHCHICSLNVPEGFATEHVRSDMHLSLLRLANTALGRLNRHTEQLIDRMTREKGTALQTSEYQITDECPNETTTNAYYCVPCNVVVESTLLESHDNELNHKKSVKRQINLAELCEIYMNDPALDTKDSSSTDLATGNKGGNLIGKFATVNAHSLSIDNPENENVKRHSIENLSQEHTDSALVQSVTVNTYSAILRKNSRDIITVGSLANCMQNKTNSQKESTDIDDNSLKSIEKPTKHVQIPSNSVFGMRKDDTPATGLLIKRENVKKNSDCKRERYEKEEKIAHRESRNNKTEDSPTDVRSKNYLKTVHHEPEKNADMTEHVDLAQNEHLNNNTLKHTGETEYHLINVVASEEKSEKAKKSKNIVSVDSLWPTVKKTSKIVQDNSHCDKPTKDAPSTSYKNAEETECNTQKNRVITVDDSPKYDKPKNDAFPLNDTNAKKNNSTVAQATNIKPLTDNLETPKQLNKKLANFYYCEICLATVPNNSSNIADHCNGKKHKKKVAAKCDETQSNETKSPIQSSVETNNAIQLLGENNNPVHQSVELKGAAQPSGGTNSANQQYDETNIAIPQSKETSFQQFDEINNTLPETDETESAIQQESKKNLVQPGNNTAECDSQKKDMFSHEDDNGINESFEQLDEVKTSNPKQEFDGPAQLANAETDLQTPTDSDGSTDCTKQFFCSTCKVYLPNNPNTVSQHMNGKIHRNKLSSMTTLITGDVGEAGKSTDYGPDENYRSSSPGTHSKSGNKPRTGRGKGRTRQSDNLYETCFICPGKQKNTAEHEQSVGHKMTSETLSGYLRYINYVGLANDVLQKKSILLKTLYGTELAITEGNWNGIVGNDSSMTYYCILCENTVGYDGIHYDEHINTLSHKQFFSHTPKRGVREIVLDNNYAPLYHCVVCNTICYDLETHIKDLRHRKIWIHTVNSGYEPNEINSMCIEDPSPVTTEDLSPVTTQVPSPATTGDSCVIS